MKEETAYTIVDLMTAYDVRRHMPAKQIYIDIRDLIKAARDGTKDERLRSICRKSLRLGSEGKYQGVLDAIRLGYEYNYIRESSRQYINSLESFVF